MNYVIQLLKSKNCDGSKEAPLPTFPLKSKEVLNAFDVQLGDDVPVKKQFVSHVKILKVLLLLDATQYWLLAFSDTNDKKTQNQRRGEIYKKGALFYHSRWTGKRIFVVRPEEYQEVQRFTHIGNSVRWVL